MIRTFVFSAIFFVLLIPSIVFADDPQPVPSQECVPPPGGKCLTQEQLEQVKKGLQELDEIHQSPATLTTQDKLTIIQDWEGRVYTNGGSEKPIRFKLKIGKTVDRDIAMTLPTQVFYRPKPPDPMFRLRIRAQLGLLVPQMVKTFSGNKPQNFLDGGIGWDFFHLWTVNLAAYTGVKSFGLNLSFDMTKNFGIFTGPVIIYQGFQFSAIIGTYFSF